MPPPTVFLATGNKGKVAEIKHQLGDLAELVPLDSVEETIRSQYDPVEDGRTFAQNAYIKAAQFFALVKKPVLAEDSGLAVDLLGGAPGVLSARLGNTDSERIERLLAQIRELGGFADKVTASFVTCACYMRGENDVIFFNGRVSGSIIENPRGGHGFGYDPIFWYEQAGQTFAEMTLEAKRRVSHRGRAFAAMARHLSTTSAV